MFAPFQWHDLGLHADETLKACSRLCEFFAKAPILGLSIRDRTEPAPFRQNGLDVMKFAAEPIFSGKRP
jgi:hypothetical protein